MTEPPIPEVMPTNIGSIQPGGGWPMRMELRWGEFRRWWLRIFHRNYVRRMSERLHFDPPPPDVIDSRDLKYSANVSPCRVDAKDDAFLWRRMLPIVHYGFAEIFFFAGPCLLIAHFFFWYLPSGLWFFSLPFLAAGICIILFFRNPQRFIPDELTGLLSPADGKVMDIEETKHRAFDEPVVRIGIFLSVLDVHVNRASGDAKVLAVRYKQGEFHDARTPAAIEKNEHFTTVFCENQPPFRRYAVRQIAGAISRRIVNELRTGQVVRAGQLFGMIKFGSRTELYVPKSQATVLCQVGDRVRAGETVLVNWSAPTAPQAPVHASTEAHATTQPSTTTTTSTTANVLPQPTNAVASAATNLYSQPPMPSLEEGTAVPTKDVPTKQDVVQSPHIEPEKKPPTEDLNPGGYRLASE